MIHVHMDLDLDDFFLCVCVYKVRVTHGAEQVITERLPRHLTQGGKKKKRNVAVCATFTRITAALTVCAAQKQTL